jgi:hypothetical protein
MPARARYRGLITSSKLSVRGHSGPHAAASFQPRLRSFAPRAAFCDFLGAGTGCSAWSVVAAVVDAVTAGANASSRVVCGELDGDADSCRLTGARIAGGGGETTAEGVVLGLGGAVAIVLGLGGTVAIGLGVRGMVAIVLRLWETAAITALPSPSWPAICTTTPLALAIDPQTSAAASGRGWCMMPPNPTAFPTDPGQGSHYWSRRQ